MKKIYLLLSLSIFFMYGCQDVNDEFDGLDDLINPENPVSYKYTIADGDYATIASAATGTEYADAGQILKAEKVFSENASPYDLIPFLLTKKYYTADVGSSALVTYQYSVGRDITVSALSTSDENKPYILGNDDYKKVWNRTPFATALTPSKSPQVQLPILLKENFNQAVSGDYKVTEYSYSENEPTETIVRDYKLNEDFDNITLKDKDPIAIDGWINVDLKGNRKWQFRTRVSNGVTISQIDVSSNGSSEANENWLIIPVDLTNATDPYLTFKIVTAYYKHSGLKIKASKNFDGNEANIKNAEWADIEGFDIPTTPESGYSPQQSAGIKSLANYVGTKAYIAFVYEGDGTANKTTTYQIDDIQIYEEVVGFDVESKETQYAAYTFDGSDWKAAASYIKVLQPEDYASMSLTNNILAKDKASHYLPIYAAKNFGYTQPGNDIVVVYQNAKGSFYADRVKCIEVGKWEVLNFVEVRSDQFVMSTKGWIFDPTINITMDKADYTIVVDYVKNKVEKEGWDASLINTSKDPGEYYYGFSGNYGNVTYRVSDREKDKTFPADKGREEQLRFMNQRVVEAFELAYLPTKLPDATPLVNGVDQKAKVTVLIYDTGGEPWNVNWTYEFQCIGNKEWKYLQRTSLLTGEVETAEE